MTKYGKFPWVDRFPASRVPDYSRQRGSIRTDIAIVGGGLTGCVTAHALAAAGLKVAVVEAERVGRGHTAASLGLIAGDPGVSFLETEKAIGRRAARHAFRSWRRAALDAAVLLRRLDVKCHLDARLALTVAFTPEQGEWLKREQNARRHAGLDAPLLPSRAITSEIAIDAAAAMRDAHAAALDPYRACLGIAAAAAEGGAQIYERTPVKRIEFGRKTVDVFTSSGTIRADRVVVATGVPTALFGSLARHFWFRRTYFTLTDAIPSRVRQQLGRRSALIRDMAQPSHLLRWLDDERLMVAGADAPSVPDRQRAKAVVQRTGQLMYELSTLYPAISGLPPAYGWDAAYARTADGLPYIGPHRNFPRHLFAFGDASRTLAGAFLASRILMRHLIGDVDPADAAFAFTRHGR